MRYVYPCILHPEEGGGFYVSFPDVRGALTSGKDRAETLDLAEDALVAALGAYFRLRQDIPLPSPIADGQESVPLPPIPAAKVALCTAMREQGITEAELAERLGIGKNAARSICNPDHRSQMDRVEKALRAVGRRLVVEDRAA